MHTQIIPDLDTDNTVSQFFDNDLAYQLQRSGVNFSPPSVTSWADIPIPAEKDKNRNEKNSQTKTAGDFDSKCEEKKEKAVSWTDNYNHNSSDNAKSVPDNSVRDNRTAMEESSPLSLNSLDDRGIQRQLSREVSRNKDREMASSLISPQAPVLSTQVLDNIDIGE